MESETDANPTLEHGAEPIKAGRARGPKMPPVVPDYNLGVSTADRAESYFDSEGRPRIASAREIAPPEDNPLGYLQRLGEQLAWLTSRGHRYWPLNVRHNVLSYYLIGKRDGGKLEALVGFLPWLLLLVADAAGLIWFYHHFELNVAMVVMLAVTALVFPLFGAWSLLRVQAHLNRIEGMIPFDDLHLSRLEPPEVLYALVVRPWSNQHLFNLLCLLLYLPALGIMVWHVLTFLAGHGQSIGLQLFSAPVIVLVAIFRWYLGTMAINLGVAFGVRARMFISGRGRAKLAALRHFFAQGGGYPLVAPLTVAFIAWVLMNWGICLFFILGVPLAYMLYLIFAAIRGRTWAILRYTIRYSRDWVVLSGSEQRDIPRYVRDLF